MPRRASGKCRQRDLCKSDRLRTGEREKNALRSICRELAGRIIACLSTRRETKQCTECIARDLSCFRSYQVHRIWLLQASQREFIEKFGGTCVTKRIGPINRASERARKFYPGSSVSELIWRARLKSNPSAKETSHIEHSQPANTV